MRKLILIATIAVVAVSCTSNNHNATGVPSSPLIPLAAGNTWIYNDSVFNQDQGGTFMYAYLDTVVVNSNTLQFSSGNGGTVVFYGLNDGTNGWFGNGSYLAVDPTNTAAYGLDSANSTSPYTFFATSTIDNALLGQSTDNTTNPTCPVTYALYGWASAFTVDSLQCLRNQQDAINCSNQVLEQINTYVAPGTGVVRIEDYEMDSTSSSLAKSFTMTLKSSTL